MADNTNIETTDTTQPEVPSVESLESRIRDLEELVSKQKKSIDAACADAKKQKDLAKGYQEKYESTLTEAQKAEEKRKEAEAAKDRRIAELERKDVISTYSNKALSLGYDADLANATAEAMANGDMDTVFAGIGKLIESVKTKTVTENLAKQASLSVGTPPTTNTVNNDEENQIRKWMGLPTKK